MLWVGIELLPERAISKIPRSEDRDKSDCFLTISVLEQEFVVLWCGWGCRYTFTRETILFISRGQFHLTFSIASKSGRLKYPSEQNRNQRQPSLPQQYPIGLNNTGQIDNYSSSIACLSLRRLPVWKLKRPIICWGQRRISQNVISRFFTNHDWRCVQITVGNTWKYWWVSTK